MSAVRSSIVRAAIKAGRRTTPSIARQAVRAFTTTPQANDYEAIHEKEIPATKFQPGTFDQSITHSLYLFLRPISPSISLCVCV